jgi:hypothetical protein
MRTSIKTIFGPGGWLGDGRAYVFAVLLPLACLAPWGIATESAGKSQTYGERWGVFSRVPFEFVQRFDLKNLDERLAVSEYVNRLHSVSTATLLAIIALSATLLGLMTAWREIRMPKDRIVFGGAWLLLITVLIWVIQPLEHGTRVMSLLGEGVYDQFKIIQAGKPYKLLNGLLIAANFIMVVGGVTLAVAVTTLAASASRLQTLNDLPTLERLRRRLDLILFASALVLGVGLIDMKQWHAWPLLFVENKDMYASLTNAFVAFQSVCYVGVLAGVYLPTAIVLDAARARIKLNASGGSVESPIASSWPTDSPAASLSSAVGPIAVLLRTVTVLSPVLVGPLATIIQYKFV